MQLLKPVCLRPRALRQEKPPPREAGAPQQGPRTAKNKINKYTLKKTLLYLLYTQNILPIRDTALGKQLFSFLDASNKSFVLWGKKRIFYQSTHNPCCEAWPSSDNNKLKTTKIHGIHTMCSALQLKDTLQWQN